MRTGHALTAAIVREAPGVDVVLTGMAIAALLVWLAWFAVGHVITIVHEAGHALTTVFTGGRVSAVRLHSDRSGLTASQLASRLATFPVTLFGYLGPSVLGVAGAFVLALGRPDVVLRVSIGLLALLLVVTRNVFGWFTVVATGLLLYLGTAKGTADVEVLVASTWIWLLLIGGLFHILEHGRHGADHAALRAMTWIPATVWSFFFTFVALAAIVVTFAMLVGGLDEVGLGALQVPDA